MEENKITPREVLKSYFEKGDYPTQDQFAELIDSLKHKEDIPTNKETVVFANSLASMDNGYVIYYINLNNGGQELKFPLVISQDGFEDQVIEIGNTYGNEKRQYFLDNGPYTIKAKKFPKEGLNNYEYYRLYYQIESNYGIYRFFGNNLPTIPEGFEFGTLTDKRFLVQIYKDNLGQQLNIVNTNIKFINNTDLSIQYRPESGYWGHRFIDKDFVTDHYHLWDYLYFYYKADLTKVTQNIVCQVYNEDMGQLLMTGYLYAGQNNVNTWGGGSANMVRNIRIECNYLNNQVIQNNQPTSTIID
ncbi:MULTISPECIES: hypothetical protein [unclassified Chryseobacterium]|uniref:hypothetical protein n=1 Tax=unclassified Chryseobacterium TaxID=2593645 RepID=UPI0030185A7B